MDNMATLINSTSRPFFNLTVADDFFFVNRDWLLIAIFWLPSVLLGLPANVLVIFLGDYAKSLGNFRFAINAISVINSLHCISRALLLLYYFLHYFVGIETSVVPCTIAANMLDKWFGYYIVFYIPILAAYRYVLLCTKGGETLLSKRNVSIVIAVIAMLPSVSIAGRIYEMFSDVKLDVDDMCSFKYSDFGCVWCMYINVYGAYLSYAMSFLFALLLFVYLYRSFRKVGDVNGSRRRLRDEIGILLCIIIQTLIPILLTIPSKGKFLFRAWGRGTVGSAFASTLYNYNPLFDAVLTIACVKPYRLGLQRIAHLGGAESTTALTRGPRSNNINRGIAARGRGSIGRFAWRM